MAFNIENFKEVPDIHRSTLFDVVIDNAPKPVTFLTRSFAMLPDKKIRINCLMDEDNILLDFFSKTDIHPMLTVNIYSRESDTGRPPAKVQFRNLKVVDFNISDLDWDTTKKSLCSITYILRYESKGIV